MDGELHLNVPFHKTGELDGCLTQLGNLEGDTCHVLVNAPGVQVHEVRKVGPDEHPVILCLGHGVPREAKCPQVLEPPQVDDLGRRGGRPIFVAAAELKTPLEVSISGTLSEFAVWP